MHQEMTTIKEVWDFYRSTILAEKKWKSQITEIGRWKHIHLCLENINTQKIRDLTPLKAFELKASLQNRGLSPQTVKHCLSLITRAINTSKKVGLYTGSIPAFDTPQFDNKRLRFLSHIEAKLLISCLKKTSPQWADISLFALMTGLRAGEIFKLTASNFDKNNQLVRFYDEKTNHCRCVPINKKAMEILCKNMGRKSSGHIFCNSHGGKWNQVSKKFFMAVENCRLNSNITDKREKIVFHSLRHTFASWLVQDGIQIQIVSQLLGHQNIKTTMRYAHLAPEQGRSAVIRLEKVKF